MTTINVQRPFTLSIDELRIAQAQMVFDRYDFGSSVRVVGRGFINIADNVVTAVEFEDENGGFDNGPMGGFYVTFANASYQIEDVAARINGNQIGHMPGAELSDWEKRLDEGVDMLDMEGVELVEDWLSARDGSKGYLLGTKLGQSKSAHHLVQSHPVIDAEDAISNALDEQRGGISVLLMGQSADLLRDAVSARRNVLQAAIQSAHESGFTKV